MVIRDETPRDIPAIRAITTAAFADMAYSTYTEAAIIDALRAAGMLTLSLVAEDAGEIIGHIAFSPVLINSHNQGWHGLGPIAVRPDRQKTGIGSVMVKEGLVRLKSLGSKGCVLVGDPGYYRRFGFRAHPGLRFDGVPPEYFQILSLDGGVPAGTVTYHPAFEAT
jgi:putative acetyltransferase